MADATPANSGKTSEPVEKRDTAKQIRWRPEFGASHPSAPKKTKVRAGNPKRTAKAPRRTATELGGPPTPEEGEKSDG
jgi:hypothetical protein